MKINKGQIIALTEGEYSDYNLRDHVRALQDFDTTEEIVRFMEIGNYLGGDEPREYGSDDRFIAWAIREHLIEPLEKNEVVEWHLGA